MRQKSVSIILTVLISTVLFASISLYFFNSQNVRVSVANDIQGKKFSVSELNTNLFLRYLNFYAKKKNPSNSWVIQKISVLFTPELQQTIRLGNGVTKETVSSAGIEQNKDELIIKINYNPEFFKEIEADKFWYDTDYLAYICLYYNDLTLGRSGCYKKASEFIEKYPILGRTVKLNKKISIKLVGDVYASTCSGTIPCGGITTLCTCANGSTCSRDGAVCASGGFCTCNYNACDPTRNNLDCSALSDTSSSTCTNALINNSCAVKCNTDAGPFCTWCQSSCTGKYCGSDGCGGSCGTCSSGYSCVAGSCCAAATSCPSYCGYPGGTVPDGFCGTTSCPATAACCSSTSPSTPTQSAPANGATYNSVTSVDLSWTAGAWGTECTTSFSRSYEVCVGNNPAGWGTDCTGGTTTTVTDPTTSLTYSQSLPDTYSWKVRQRNKDGNYSSWSSTWTFSITNNYPTLGSASPSEIPATGTTTLTISASDLDGATDINRIYFGFNNCSVATGDAANSNFERNLSNYFGGMFSPNFVNGRGWGFTANINTGAACTGNSGDGTPWGTSFNVNPLSVTSTSNATGTITTTGMTYSSSGNTLTGSWDITTSGLTPGSGLNYYSMAMDNELLYTTGSTSPAWTKLTALCVEGFDAANTSYVSAWSSWSACDMNHQRTRTRTCTQDCLSVDDCAAIGTSETEDCLGTISGTLYDASDCAAGVCSCGGDTIGASTFVVAPQNGFDLVGGNTVAIDMNGNYSFNSYLVGAPLNPNNFNFDFSNLVAAGKIGSATPKATCPTPGTPYLYSCDFTDPIQPCKTSTYNFGFYRQFGGWWQAQGGSIYATTNVNSFIPSSIASSEQKLILPDSNGRDGLLNYGGTASIGNTSGVVVSDSGLEFNGTYDGTSYKYNYFNNIWSLLTKTTMTVGQTTLPAYVDNNGGGYMLLKYSGALTLDSFSVTGGQKYILLADSTVNITGNITVDSGSFLAIISKGTITVDPSVTTMQGWYLSDGKINFDCTDLDGNGCDQTDSQITVSGTLIGWQGFTLSRDLGLGNNSAPAELFVYRLDLSENAPEIFKVSYQVYGSYAP